MKSVLNGLRWSAAAFVLTSVLAATAESAEISFRLDEGRNINSFTRDGEVAAHLLLRSGDEPRILVAFPAGNGGVGLWFAKTTAPVKWNLIGEARPITMEDSKGRPLRGIEVQADVSAHSLRIDRAVLSSIRVLRDFERLRTAPNEIATTTMVVGSKMSWARDRLDGTAGYQLTIEALGESKVSPTEITAAAGAARLRLKITALTGEEPLTPLSSAQLLNSRANGDTRSRDVLTFLSYHEKFLAGSWRFDTYFGRDTLMSMTLLAPALQPAAIGAGVESVLERLAPNGEVAHEEDIGEFAVLRNRKEGRGRNATPIYDYGMVDDDFMLAPLAAKWLLDEGLPQQKAADLLLAKIDARERTGDALVRNFVWVVNRTAEFAKDPVATKLVRIKEGRRTGNWRDSEEGLGRGVYPYDINVALVPAALESIDRLAKSGLLDSYVSGEQDGVLAAAAGQRDVWTKKASALFKVQASAEIAFDALSLDESGEAVPVMHSDGGFTLLFGEPSAEQIERIIGTLLRPFPKGLLTPVGMVVANPAFAERDAQERFSNTAYHGTVVWSWQQALMAAGLERQLTRKDLPTALRGRIDEARTQLWSAIAAAGSLQASELWSWSFADHCYKAEPFGARRSDVDESNAAQLWSTVFLALKPAAQATPAKLCLRQ